MISKHMTTKRVTDKKSNTADVKRPRTLRLPPYKLFRLKRIKHPIRLPSVWYLAKVTCRLLWSNRKLFLGIFAIYGVLNILFVHGLSSGTVTLATIFGGADSNTNAATGVYQLVLGLIASLATIWALRQVSAGEKIRIRDAFYKGMTPLIPFVLVFVVIALQTVPFLIGGGLYNLAVSYGIAATLMEKALWGLLFVVLAFTSIFMLCSSLFALYIVTLPDMTPLKALRSARQLVGYRRLAVIRKLFFLLLALVIIAALIMVPVILFVNAIAGWIFFLLGVLVLIVIHTYMYTLYRELLS
jgi:hypothetical protein